MEKKKWWMSFVILILVGGMILYGISHKGKSPETLYGTGDSQTGKGADGNSGPEGGGEENAAQDIQKDSRQDIEEGQLVVEQELMIDASGMILQERIHTPEGYERTAEKGGSLGEFLRNYEMKGDGEPVLLFDGSPKGNQSAHVAVFKLPLEEEDLQQCADSVMRVYAEYYWHTGKRDRIAFHFVDGFLAEYSKWKQGYKIQVSDSGTSWVSGTADDSYEGLQKYLRMVFAYASTLSMEGEAEKINVEDMQIGDVFLEGGSPGHVVMLVDMCENESGNKAFLLAQGYMPAQEFHVLKNPRHEEDPWYYEEEVSYPFSTPEYTFGKGSLRRLEY